MLAEVFAKQGNWEKSSESYADHNKLHSELISKQLQNIYNLIHIQFNKKAVFIDRLFYSQNSNGYSNINMYLLNLIL